MKILYYKPSNSVYHRWKYGIDIVEKLIKIMPEHDFISADGSQDMNKLYQEIDLYIRPSRHDAGPRMVNECKKREIPIIYFDHFKPNLDEFYNMIKSFENIYGY